MRSYAMVFLILLLLSAGVVLGQDRGIPYLVNGKYGLADTSGNMLGQPKYDKASLLERIPFTIVQIGNTWGVVNIQGTWVYGPRPFQSADELKRVFRETTIRHVFYQGSLQENGPYNLVPLYEIYDPILKMNFYIHGQYLSQEHLGYIDLDRVRPGGNSEALASRVATGITKVGTKEQGITFLDTLGNRIFKEDVWDGIAITEHIIEVEDTAGLFQLFSRQQKPISDYLYLNILLKSDDKFLLCVRMNPNGENEELIYDVYTRDGSLILADQSTRPGLFQNCYVHYANDTAFMYSTQGELRKYFPRGKVNEFFQSPGVCLLEMDDKMGLIDCNGEKLLDLKYEKITCLWKNIFLFQNGNKYGLINYTFQEAWSLDSLSLEYMISGNPRFMHIVKETDGVRSFGVIDTLGQIVIPPEYRTCRYFNGFDMFLLEKDSLQSLVRTNGDIVIPNTTGDISPRTHGEVEDGFIFVTNGPTETVYSYTGEFIATGRAGYLDLDRKISPWRFVEENGLVGLMNLEGKILIPPRYTEKGYDEINDVFIFQTIDSTFAFPRGGMTQGYYVGPPGLCQVQRMGENYFQTRIETGFREKKRMTVCVFKSSGELINMIYAHDVSYFWCDKYLPRGYFSVRDTPSAIPYLLDYRTGRRFKE